MVWAGRSSGRQNLVGERLKFTPDGFEIVLKLRHTALASQIVPALVVALGLLIKTSESGISPACGLYRR